MEPLNKDNYKYNHDYLSYSRFSKFLRCEASAAANYSTPSTISQLIGSYVDAYFSDELEQFKQDHPEIYNSRTGELKKDFIQAETLITRIKSDENFLRVLDGEKQAIMTGTIDNVPFKIKMDAYKPHEFITDLKVLKDFQKVWSDAYRCSLNFVEAYDYDIELAIFQEIVYQNTGEKLPCYLACITKEEPSDIGIFQLSQKQLDKAMELVKENLPRIKGILDGKIAPHRCEKCAYCRGTKKAKILPTDYIGYNGDQLREMGVECNDEIIIKKEQ